MFPGYPGEAPTLMGRLGFSPGRTASLRGEVLGGAPGGAEETQALP